MYISDVVVLNNMAYNKLKAFFIVKDHAYMVFVLFTYDHHWLIVFVGSAYNIVYSFQIVKSFAVDNDGVYDTVIYKIKNSFFGLFHFILPEQIRTSMIDNKFIAAL